MRLSVLKLAAAALLAAVAVAHAAPSHPDLSGYWELMRTIPQPDPELMAKVAPDTALLMDTGATEFPRGEYGGLKLRPEALKQAQAWKPQDDMSLSKVCAPPSIVYAMQGPFPLRIDQGTELMVIRLEYYDMARVVFLDGRGHLPADAPDSKVGDSVGRWDGNILVVDTTHLEPATITNNGLFHSNRIHVIERFKLSADGRTLYATQEFEDPQTLENRGVRFLAWEKREGRYIYPYDCDPSYALNYGKPGQ